MVKEHTRESCSEAHYYCKHTTTQNGCNVATLDHSWENGNKLAVLGMLTGTHLMDNS